MSIVEHESLKALDEALSVLEGGFSTLLSPSSRRHFQRRAAKSCSEDRAAHARTTYPYPHPCVCGPEVLKPPMPWRGSPTCWPSGSKSQQPCPRRRSCQGSALGGAKPAWRPSRPCSVTPITWSHLSASGTIPPTWKPCGSRAMPSRAWCWLPSQAHYIAHSRMCEVLGLPFKSRRRGFPRSHGELGCLRRPLEA